MDGGSDSTDQPPSSVGEATSRMRRPGRRGRRIGRVRRELQLLNSAWMLGTFWVFAISGAAMAQFAIALDTPAFGFGLLAALPFLASFLQLPGSYVLERFGNRRLLMLWSFSLGRLMWVAAAAVPWIFHKQPEIWWKLLILLVGLAWAGEHFGQPSAS